MSVKLDIVVLNYSHERFSIGGMASLSFEDFVKLFRPFHFSTTQTTSF
jgi:hypothetical protein